MGVVYQVRDIKNGKEVALKQLLPEPDNKSERTIIELFEQEFYILAQLAHPRVIEVYDFGTSEDGPYYTMELLDGGDLRTLSPLPWREACSLAIDICSALGFLHSRRHVHRDITPRNIRCTRDRKAKLIDFGAMAPMGPCKFPAGTPAYTSPEVASIQSLDARADLYSLGATLYYALTGRNPYNARHFYHLGECWKNKPLPPSNFITGIPAELDSLVFSLISLDLMARPRSAAEVMERLSAIAGIEPDDQLAVSQACLSSPTIVGRDAQISEIRSGIERMLSGNGGTVTLEGKSGLGRSRLLDVCALEGKTSGVTVLRADGSDAHAGPWGTARTLAEQLLDALPEIAWDKITTRFFSFSRVFPELIERHQNRLEEVSVDSSVGERSTTSENSHGGFNRTADVWARGFSSRPPPLEKVANIESDLGSPEQPLRPRLLADLRDWFVEVSERQPLMVAIDDLHLIDEPSAAFIAYLSRESTRKKLFIGVTIDTDAPGISSIAVKLIKDNAKRLELAHLTGEQTEGLLLSVFGETDHIRLLADRIQTVSNGNPQTVMRLAQYLVNKGMIYYRQGAWVLPTIIEPSDLPSSSGETFQARLQRLNRNALQLAQAIALSPQQTFSYDECHKLADNRETGLLIQSLDQLVAEEILITDGSSYWLSPRAPETVLRAVLDPIRERVFHVRLAEIFMKRGNELLRAGQHLLASGQENEALDAFIGFSQASKTLTDRNPAAFSELIQSLPKNWFETYQEAIHTCERRNRPRKCAYDLRLRLSGLVSLVGQGDTDNFEHLLKQLSADSGLTIYQTLDPGEEPQKRLAHALELAQQRYQSSPESERVLAPIEAIRELAKVLVQAIGVIATSYDYRFWLSLPSLKPYISLSPALEVVDLLIKAIGYRITGRSEQCCVSYRGVIERTSQPDGAGLEETYRTYVRYGVMRGLGMTEAAMGLSSSLQWASEIEADPLHQVNAWRIRALYHIWQGSTAQAEQCKQRVELLQIQNSPTQWFEGSQLGQESFAYALSDDLIGLKASLDAIEKMAQIFPTWQSTLLFASAEYQRILGNHSRALEIVRDAFTKTAPGRSHDWIYIASAYIRTLAAAGDDSEAVRKGDELLAAAQEAGLGYLRNHVRLPLALARAKLSDFETAIALTQTAIDEYQTMGTTGLNLGLAYETRARIAGLMNERGTFLKFAKLCSEHYQTDNNPALSARYDKLLRDARNTRLGASLNPGNAQDFVELTGTGDTINIISYLSGCQNSHERARRALDLLVSQANCQGGYLYTIHQGEPILAAQHGDQAPPAAIDQLINARVAEEIAGAGATEMVGGEAGLRAGEDVTDQGETMSNYRTILLGHFADEKYIITGIAMLIMDPDKRFNYPGHTVEILSRSFVDTGDVVGVDTRIE
jgi:serine/threonine protein kinase